MTYYGAIFTEKEIEAVFSEAQKAVALYTEKNFFAAIELRNVLCKVDYRFLYTRIDRNKVCMYVYGIHLEAIKDDEVFGDFKKKVQLAIEGVFKKPVTTAFYEIRGDDNE